MLVHHRVTPSIKFAGPHLYTWVEKGTVRVKCLAQEHNTMSPARAQTRIACLRVERHFKEDFSSFLHKVISYNNTILFFMFNYSPAKWYSYFNDMVTVPLKFQLPPLVSFLETFLVSCKTSLVSREKWTKEL